MDLLEARIFENYSKVHVDDSFSAESMYLNRGYQIISYEKIETENRKSTCNYVGRTYGGAVRSLQRAYGSVDAGYLQRYKSS